MDEIAQIIGNQLDLQYSLDFGSWNTKIFGILANFGQKMAKNVKMWFIQKRVWIFLETTTSARIMKFGRNMKKNIV